MATSTDGTENRPALNIEHGESHVFAQGACRVLVVGKTGSGKSTLGNKLLGQERFTVCRGNESITTMSQKEERDDNRRKMLVVDTPGLFDTHTGNAYSDNEFILMEVSRALAFTLPGPHAIVFVFRWGRFTKEEMDAFELVVDRFKDSPMIVAFTGTEELKKHKESVSKYTGSSQMKRILEVVHDNYAELTLDGSDEMYKLHKLIDRVSDNLKKHYTNEQLNAMAEEIDKEIKKRVTEKKITEEEAVKEIAKEMSEKAWIKPFLISVIVFGGSLLVGGVFAGVGGSVAAALGYASKKVVYAGASGVAGTAGGVGFKAVCDWFNEKFELQKKRDNSSCCVS